MKKLFNICALPALQPHKEIKAYYPGKHKMAVVNAVRNKSISRIFAVVNSQSPFVDNYNRAA